MPDQESSEATPPSLDAMKCAGPSSLSRLRQVNLALVLALPAAILVSRTVAELIVAITGLSFLAVCVKSRSWSWVREPPVAVALALWVVANLIVSPFAIDVAASFGSSLSWIRFVLFFAATTTWLITEERDLRVASWCLSAIVMAGAVDTLVQWSTGVSLSGQEPIGGRLTGILDRPNIGIFLAKLGFPTFALLAWFSVRSASPRITGASVGVCLTALAAILLTGERTATLLTLLGLLVVLAWVFVSWPRLRLPTIILSFTLAGAVALVVSVVEFLQLRVLALVEVLSNFGESPYGELFVVAFRAFVDNPLTGVGLKGFRVVCPDYEAQGYISICMPHAHNIYLEWLAEGGLIAFTLFVVLVGVLFVTLLRTTRCGKINPISTGFFVGALLVSLFPFAASQSFLSNWPAALLWFSLAITLAASRVMARTPR